MKKKLAFFLTAVHAVVSVLAQCPLAAVGERTWMEGHGAVVGDSGRSNQGAIQQNCIWTNDSPRGALRALDMGGTGSDDVDLGSDTLCAPKARRAPFAQGTREPGFAADVGGSSIGTGARIWGVRRVSVAAGPGGLPTSYSRVTNASVSETESPEENDGYNPWRNPDMLGYDVVGKQCAAGPAGNRMWVFMVDPVNRAALRRPAMDLCGTENARLQDDTRIEQTFTLIEASRDAGGI